MPRWKIRLFSHVGLLSGPRAKIRTPCHQPPPPPPSKSNFLYSLSHPPPLSSPLPTPLTFLTAVLRASAGGRAPAVGGKGGSAPPPTLRSDSGGSEQLAVGIASTARVSAIFIFLDIFAEIIFTWVGLGDSVKISFSHADALPARENDNLCGHLDADGTKVCM